MSIIYDLSKVPADVVAQIHASPKYTKWFSEFPTKLLGVSGDDMVFFNRMYEVYFYDYTKIANRLVPDSSVYDLTFSYSGVEKYQRHVDTARAMGMRMAVVFRYRTQIPKSFLGMDVVDGDDSDLRFLEPQGVVSALYAKGKAVHDTSGFVIDA